MSLDYRLLGPDPTGYGVGGRRLSPFLGRTVELGFLRERLTQVAGSAHGHAVNLIGEPGVGKSRLLYEFRRNLAGGVECLEIRCTSYGSGVPYLPLIDLLRGLWDVPEGASPATASRLVRERLASLGVGGDDVHPYVLHLLAIADPAEPLPGLSPATLGQRISEALRRVLVAHALRRPLALLVEDLHWVDRSSLGVFGAVVDGLPATPVLLVTTTRPGLGVPWADRSWVSQLALPPLSTEASRELVRAAVHETCPVDEVTRLVARGEGNPFFLEELTRAAMESGTSDRPDIPPTIADALMARMSRVGPEFRRILETAAVLGREVPDRLLERVYEGTTEQVAAGLRDLVSREFLYPVLPATHVFTHALTQEVAYSRLGVAEREHLHTRAAEALEELHTGRVDEVLGRLAHHWDLTCNHDKAVHYLHRFADNATRTYALTEAVGAIERALVHCEQIEGDDRERLAVESVNRLGMPLVMLGRPGEIPDRLLPHRERVERLGDPALAGPFFFSLAMAYDQTGAYDRAEELSLRAASEANRCGDASTAGRASVFLAFSSLWSSDFRRGLDRARQAAPNLGGPADQFWLSLAHWLEAHHLLLLGDLAGGRRAGDAARTIGEQADDGRLQSYGLCMVAWQLSMAGAVDEAVAVSQRAIDLTTEPLGRAAVQGYVGEVYGIAHMHAEGRRHLEEAIAFFRRGQFAQTEAWNLGRLAELEGRAGNARQSARLAREALTLATTAKFPYAQGLAERALGQALMEAATAEACVHLERAVDLLTRIEARFDAAVARIGLARACEAMGDTAAAASLRTIATSELRAMGASPAYLTVTRQSGSGREATSPRSGSSPDLDRDG